jgi:hypothetical protein
MTEDKTQHITWDSCETVTDALLFNIWNALERLIDVEKERNKIMQNTTFNGAILVQKRGN